MADTRAYTAAEKWIRDSALPSIFPGHEFTKRMITVGFRSNGNPADHEFDAVSEDEQIVVSIKASTGLTKGKKRPVGKITNAYSELHFLSLVKATLRILVLSDPEFYAIFSKDSDGKLPAGVEVLHVTLPPELQEKVLLAAGIASAEVSPRR